MSLNERIQALRKNSNHSQEELANMLDISRQAISKWESGQVQPEIDNIIKLSKIYNVSTDYLLTGDDDDVNKAVDDTDFNISQETKNIIAIIGATAIIVFVFIASLYWMTK